MRTDHNGHVGLYRDFPKNKGPVWGWGRKITCKSLIVPGCLWFDGVMMSVPEQGCQHRAYSMTERVEYVTGAPNAISYNSEEIISLF